MSRAQHATACATRTVTQTCLLVETYVSECMLKAQMYRYAEKGFIVLFVYACSCVYGRQVFSER